MVAEKLDPTIFQLCFHRNFQTVGNLKKGTTGMSSEGPKIVERSSGLAGNGLKWPKNQEKPDDPLWPPPSAAQSRPVRRRLAVKTYRRDRLDVPLLPVRRVLQVAGRWCLLWSKPPRLAKGQTAQLGVHDFWRVFPRVWSSRWCLGARVSFGIQSYVYIGPRVAFR